MVAAPRALAEMRVLNSPFPHTAVIRDWKARGGRVFAFQCTYVPEEAIHAAGILPVRLRGGGLPGGTPEASAYLYGNTCSFIRNCLEGVFQKQWPFLDGLVSAATCDCTRRLADVWAYYNLTPFSHVLGAPRRISERGYSLYASEIRQLLEKLNGHYGYPATPARLKASIAIYNERRALLRQLNELRKQDAPPITGAEALDVLNASSSLPPEIFNPLLRGLLGELNGRTLPRPRFRLMVSGSPLHDPGFITMVEEMGGMVVIDELCTGVRYWWESVEPGPDPVMALARRYLHNFACPRMEPSTDRQQRVLRLARDYHIDGVVAQVVHYCVPQTMEQPILKDLLAAEGVPVLELDVEYGGGASGQLRTRLQAFVEMLSAKVAK
jgi:benzoyl-CoA reductase/2-hydroxyglutaryl-CoA dehydratase subunit BcrC/BadD/HgdB